jgi:hypothetical protein
METARKFFGGLFSAGIGILMLPLLFAMPMAWAYSMWCDVRGDNFLMFFFDLFFPPWGVLRGIILFFTN